jgi:hypothetical protein
MSVIPEGAEEFTSDGMPALRFLDGEGDVCEVRIVRAGAFEARWFASEGPWHPYGEEHAYAEPGVCYTEPAHPWIRAQWAKMLEYPFRETEKRFRVSEINSLEYSGHGTAWPGKYIHEDHVNRIRRRLVRKWLKAKGCYFSQKADIAYHERDLLKMRHYEEWIDWCADVARKLEEE